MAHLLVHESPCPFDLTSPTSSSSYATFDASSEFAFKKKLQEFCSGSDGIVGSPPVPFVWKAFPGELFLAGGSMSVLLDATLDSSSFLYANSDLDFFVLGSSKRKQEIVDGFLSFLNVQYPCRAIGVSITGNAVINVWISGWPRRIKLVLVNEGCEHIADALSQFDFTHLQCAYDGVAITMTAAAITAMATRETVYAFVKADTPTGDVPTGMHRHTFEIKLNRVYKAMIRNYTVRDCVFKFADIMTANKEYMNSSVRTSPSPHQTGIFVMMGMGNEDQAYNLTHLKLTGVFDAVEWRGVTNIRAGY
jgi:hypothetical protein